MLSELLKALFVGPKKPRVWICKNCHSWFNPVIEKPAPTCPNCGCPRTVRQSRTNSNVLLALMENDEKRRGGVLNS